jgi:methyltransferase (TIGR00027 family)
MTIENISDTARWVAMYRAMESERPDAIFRDPYARRLAGPRGEEILDAMPRGRQTAWPMVVRTKILDDYIETAVRRDGVDVVLNLAAGLDSRPFRMDPPASLRWIEVDLPPILGEKQALMRGERPRCVLEQIPLDLADRPARQALFARVGASARQVLVMTEGLLVYLEPEQVAELASDLHAQPSFRWWLADIIHPRVLEMISRSWGKQLAAGGSQMKFAPAEGPDYFRRYGWTLVEVHGMLETAFRLHRAPRMMWLWALLGRLQPAAKREELRRGSGIIKLERV